MKFFMLKIKQDKIIENKNQCHVTIKATYPFNEFLWLGFWTLRVQMALQSSSNNHSGVSLFCLDYLAGSISWTPTWLSVRLLRSCLFSASKKLLGRFFRSVSILFFKPQGGGGQVKRHTVVVQCMHAWNHPPPLQRLCNRSIRFQDSFPTWNIQMRHSISFRFNESEPLANVTFGYTGTKIFFSVLTMRLSVTFELNIYCQTWLSLSNFNLIWWSFWVIKMALCHLLRASIRFVLLERWCFVTRRTFETAETDMPKPHSKLVESSHLPLWI